jgi:hypothetical protein
MSVLLLQMARAEDVEDHGDLNGARPEAEVNPVLPEAEVDPALPSETSEGSSAAPVSTVSGEGSLPAPAPTAEDPRRRWRSWQQRIPWRRSGLRRWLSRCRGVSKFCLCY